MQRCHGRRAPLRLGRRKARGGAAPRTSLARGAGCSYGDAALNVVATSWTSGDCA